MAQPFAISVPSHDLSHYFWSVLLQVFFLADSLTLPSRVDRPLTTSTLLLSAFRIMCPPTLILSSEVLPTLIWSTYNHLSLDICCTTSTPALFAAVRSSPSSTSWRGAESARPSFFFLRSAWVLFFRGARRGQGAGWPNKIEDVMIYSNFEQVM